MANEDDDKDWCSINEAARRLKVTPTAIRNRIKRGTLDTKPNGNFGKLVRVPLPVIPTVPATITPTDPSTVSDTVSDTVTLTNPLIPELRAQITHLEERLAGTQAELVAMAQKVGAAEGEIAGLKAQAIETRADRDAWRQQAERLSERQPWWRRLVG
jgi:hypothetical protein